MAVFKRLPDQFLSDTSVPYNNGYLYIGEYGQDPTIPANQITIYADEDKLATLANPQRLDSFGRPENDIYLFEDYSYTIDDADSVQVENKSVRLHIRDRNDSARILSVVVSNGRYFGGGMHVAPEASLNDNLLDVVVIGGIGKFDLLKSMPMIYNLLNLSL